MTTTLGYQDGIRIAKDEIAKVQLTEAISLFLVGKYLCAITLSGAAEEIFARLLNVRDEKSTIETSFQAIQDIREQVGFASMDSRPKNWIFNEWNTARNTLKHHGKDSEDSIEINLFDEAYWMIKRALSNAAKLSLAVDNELDFENWIVVNINF